MYLESTHNHESIARSLKQQPKLYFFDTPLVQGDAQRLENLAALSLYRHLCFLEDNDGVQRTLCYLRTKEGREVDFLLVKERKPVFMVEIKSCDHTLDEHLRYFNKRYEFPGIQLVGDLRLEKDSGSLKVRRLFDYLSTGLGKDTL